MDKFTRRLISQCAEDNWDTIVKHSISNYLVKGFNSIILSMSSELVLRLYITEPGTHRLHNSDNLEDNTLLIHNHGFDFQCQTIIGTMTNLVFVEDVFATSKWYKYKYISGMSRGTHSEVIFQDEVALKLASKQVVNAGDSYYMHHTQLHRIYVPKERTVAMLFWEHRHKEDHEQVLYSYYPLNNKVPVTNTQPSEAEIRRLIRLVLEH